MLYAGVVGSRGDAEVPSSGHGGVEVVGDYKTGADALLYFLGG